MTSIVTRVWSWVRSRSRKPAAAQAQVRRSSIRPMVESLERRDVPAFPLSMAGFPSFPSFPSFPTFPTPPSPPPSQAAAFNNATNELKASFNSHVNELNNQLAAAVATLTSKFNSQVQGFPPAHN